MSTADGRIFLNELKLAGCIYCGGEDSTNGGHISKEQERHFRYYKLKEKTSLLPKIPERKESCVCGHSIWWQCYIMKPKSKPTDEMIIVGNCCIKLFTGGKLRTCSICGVEHKNRKYDLCNIHKEQAIKAEKAAKAFERKRKKDLIMMIEDPDMPEPEWFRRLRREYGYFRGCS